MTLFLRFYPGEIGGDSLLDELRLSLAEFLKNPLVWIAGILAVVAAFDPRAGWHDVFGSIRATSTKRDEMILGHRVPQTARSAAISATVVPVIKATLPIFQCEGGRQGALSGASSLATIPVCIRVALFVLARPYASLGNTVRASAALLIVSANRVSLDISIVLVLAVYLWFVTFVIQAGAFALLFWICLPVVSLESSMAGLARRGKSILPLLLSSEILRSSRKLLAALCATLRWGVHRASPSLYRMMLSADGAIDRRFSWGANPNLADSQIVPQRGG
jgi:hypothetical protein